MQGRDFESPREMGEEDERDEAEQRADPHPTPIVPPFTAQDDEGVEPEAAVTETSGTVRVRVSDSFH